MIDRSSIRPALALVANADSAATEKLAGRLQADHFQQLLRAALALGGYLSFSGILTFPKSQEIRDIARDTPRERLLVETDSPYLAPVPFRGKRNEPGHVGHTARVLGELHGLDPAGIAEERTRARLWPRN